MLLDDLRVKRDAIFALGNQYGARHIRVFGSVARGEERPDSDIDFLVDLPRGYDLFAQRLPLTERLQSLLQRHVELVPEDKKADWPAIPWREISGFRNILVHNYLGNIDPLTVAASSIIIFSRWRNVSAPC